MSNTPIPLMDLRTEHMRLLPEFTAITESVVENGQFILGPEVKAFEKSLQDYHGVAYAVGLNSGTDALVIALRALDIGPGDEVILPTFTFFATAEAVSIIGAQPVFADVDADSFNICPKSFAKLITPKTKAVIPVHLFGSMADMSAIMPIAKESGLKVIEDNAQSFGAAHQGALAGTFGDVCTFSFFPAKVLGALGDAGAIITPDAELAEKARMLRFHGCRKKYYNEVCGYNSRLDEVQAAFLNIKIKHIQSYIEGRRQAARYYDEAFGGSRFVTKPISDPEGVYGQYTLKLPTGTREQVSATLKEASIGHAIYYPVPLHSLPMYKDLNASCPVAEDLAARVLSIPIWPGITQAQQDRVIATMNSVFS